MACKFKKGEKVHIKEWGGSYSSYYLAMLHFKMITKTDYYYSLTHNRLPYEVNIYYPDSYKDIIWTVKDAAIHHVNRKSIVVLIHCRINGEDRYMLMGENYLKSSSSYNLNYLPNKKELEEINTKIIKYGQK